MFVGVDDRADGSEPKNLNESKEPVQGLHPRHGLFSFALETTMADELADNIETNAAAPKRATADGVTVEQHSIDDQIKAARFAASKAQGANPFKKLTTALIVKPGAAGD